MAYSDDAVKAKLNSLNETQDSIVANAQWIMFHRRHADRTASQWLARLQDVPTAKRLVLIYLANEVVQQSRARGKQDFLLAFEPVIAEATALAYKGASSDVQGKLRRVVEVWRQRSIFDKRILDVVDSRLDELDKQRGSKIGGGGKLGGSLFGSGGPTPPELDKLSKTQTLINKTNATREQVVKTASTEYEKVIEQNTESISPPVEAAKLGGLLKVLASAQSAVEASIKARQDLIGELEKLLEGSRTSLLDDQKILETLTSNKDKVENRKREVEDNIIRGLSSPSPPATQNGQAAHQGPEKPEVEGFTPPPDDQEPAGHGSETLAGDPAPLIGEDLPEEHHLSNTTGAEFVHEQSLSFNEPPPTTELPPALPEDSSTSAADRFLDSFHLPTVRYASGEIPAEIAGDVVSDPRMKRRKMNHQSRGDVDEDIFGNFGADGGVDEEGVSALLG